MMDILKGMSDEEVLALANTETPQPLPGTWELMAPDGRIWTGASPIKCLHAEINARVPPQLALARIRRGLMEEAAEDARGDDPQAIFGDPRA
ncbi:MAG: hypothetical protein ABMA00_15450 [Gemmatimonas sp.]